RDQGSARYAHAARSEGAAHALRHRDEHRPYAGGSGQAVRRDAGAHTPDRGESAAETAASVALGTLEELSRPGRLISGGAGSGVGNERAAASGPFCLRSKMYRGPVAQL